MDTRRQVIDRRERAAQTRPMTSKPILITGGTGKTGSRIVQRLEARGVPVRVGSRSGTPSFDWEDRVGKWMPVASGEEGFAPIRIHQDMKVLVGVIGSDETLYYDLDPARQAYLIQIEGEGVMLHVGC